MTENGNVPLIDQTDRKSDTKKRKKITGKKMFQNNLDPLTLSCLSKLFTKLNHFEVKVQQYIISQTH